MSVPIHPVKHIYLDGKGHPVPYAGMAIAKKEIHKHDVVHKFGNSESIGAAGQTLWTGTNSYYTYLGSCQQLRVTSTNSVDGAGTTGAQVVTLFGLDEDFNEQQEVIELNGITPVTTVNCYCRMNRIVVNSAGPLGWNAGEIWATDLNTAYANSGEPTFKLAHVHTGNNQTLMCLWTVPADKLALIPDIQVSGNKNKGVDWELVARPFGEVFQVKLHHHLFQQAYQFHYKVPIRFEAKTDLEMRVRSDASNTEVSGQFCVITVED